MPSTVGCLAIPSLPLACELADRPELRGRPVAVVHSEQPVIWAVSRLARERGVMAGQQVRHSLSICPELDVIEGRPARYATAMEDVIKKLHTVVYGIEHPDQGTIYLDLTGLQLGGDALATAILGCVPKELQPRLGLACQRFTARVAAYQARPNTAKTVNEPDLAGFLAPQPVDVLPVNPATIQQLYLLGLTTLGDIASLPMAAVAAEFGAVEGNTLWRLSRGHDVDHVSAYTPTELIAETLAVETPIVTSDHLMVAIEQVVNQICRSPQFTGRSARRAQLTLITERGGRKDRTINFHQPVSESRELSRLLAPALRDMQLPGAVCEIRLQLEGLSMAQGWQKNLPVANGGRHEFLEEGLRKLQTQYGNCPVASVMAMDPDNRLPEKRWALVDLTP